MKFNIIETLKNYSRVLKIAKKPTVGEFSKSAKICTIGIAVVGVIGFMIYLLSAVFLG